MVMKPEPWFAALRAVVGEDKENLNRETILLSPKGERLTQKLIERLCSRNHLVLMCGRYEDVDDRVRQQWVSTEISLGDFVINGGELAAQVLIEGITRLLPGALGDPESAGLDSFSSGILDHRHFTKPAEFERLKVPEVLLSGNHEEIRRWRLKDALTLTLRRRPDLLESKELTKEEKRLLKEIRNEDAAAQ